MIRMPSVRVALVEVASETESTPRRRKAPVTALPTPTALPGVIFSSLRSAESTETQTGIDGWKMATMAGPANLFPFVIVCVMERCRFHGECDRQFYDEVTWNNTFGSITKSTPDLRDKEGHRTAHPESQPSASIRASLPTKMSPCGRHTPTRPKVTR